MPRRIIGSIALIVVVLGTGAALGARKYSSLRAAEAAAAQQSEPMESVSVATAEAREHRAGVTSIGTVLATRSIVLRNELAGTVSDVALTPGRLVDAGTVLVALDVSVEQADLLAQQAQAQLAQTILDRNQQASDGNAVSQIEVDRARAERDVALAQVERTKAIIARKTIRAPFPARVGMSDVHRGQYLAEGTELTTLQGVDEAVHVDFAVPQRVAAGLKPRDRVAVVAGATPIPASIVAVDARIDPTTRNALVRARVEDGAAIAPGSSVRVEVPDGPAVTAVSIPVSALRKGPAGDHVFVVSTGPDGSTRAHVREVHSGPVLGEVVLVLEGLEPGEQVATSGSFKLREGVLVAAAGSGGQ
jgi:membrane fusion protein, multidrug efflux system